jgi:hypothetical protein
MAVAFIIVWVSLAAICLWLAIRVFNRRERWAKWILGFVVALIAYPLSLGPVAFLDNRDFLPNWLVPMMDVIYAPLFFLLGTSEEIAKIWLRYRDLWTR